MAARVFTLSLREAWRNRVGIILMFSVPCIFLAVVNITAGEGTVPVNLYFWGETLHVLLTVRLVCLVFGAAGVCGFLSAYYALILFHQDFDYFRYCAFAGLRPGAFMAGRFAFFLVLVLVLAILSVVLTGKLVSIYHPLSVFLGFLLLGTIYGAFGGIVSMFTREFLVAFLCVALLADIDAAWLQNPAYYSAGQNLGIIRWLPAFYPCQQIFAGGFTEDENTMALLGSLAYAGVLLVALLIIIAIRLGRVSRITRATGPVTGREHTSVGEMP